MSGALPHLEFYRFSNKEQNTLYGLFIYFFYKQKIHTQYKNIYDNYKYVYPTLQETQYIC